MANEEDGSFINGSGGSRSRLLVQVKSSSSDHSLMPNPPFDSTKISGDLNQTQSVLTWRNSAGSVGNESENNNTRSNIVPLNFDVSSSSNNLGNHSSAPPPSSQPTISNQDGNTRETLSSSSRINMQLNCNQIPSKSSLFQFDDGLMEIIVHNSPAGKKGVRFQNFGLDVDSDYLYVSPAADVGPTTKATQTDAELLEDFISDPDVDRPYELPNLRARIHERREHNEDNGESNLDQPEVEFHSDGSPVIGPSDAVTLLREDSNASRPESSFTKVPKDEALFTSVPPQELKKEKRKTRKGSKHGDSALPPSSIHSRKPSIARRSSLLRSNKISPETLGDDPSEKARKRRKNSRKNLGYLNLIWHDFKRWIHLQRTKRRDPILLWRKEIKQVEGHFGSGVASFFVFARWIFLLNLLLSVVFSGLVVIPGAFHMDFSGKGTLRAENLLDGKGVVGESFVFFGGYSEFAGGLNIALTYLLAVLIAFALSLFFVIRSIASIYGVPEAGSFSLVQNDEEMPFTFCVFTSWDYSITTIDGVDTLQRGISNFLQNKLVSSRDEFRDSESSQDFDRSLFILIWRRAFAWLLWLVLLCASLWAVWYLIIHNHANNTFLSTYSAPLCFSTINIIMPFFIRRLVRFERYKSGHVDVKITIFRTLVLRLLSLYALLYGLYRSTSLFSAQTPAYVGVHMPQESCSGTIVGQLLYTLVLFDTLIAILVRLFWTLVALITNTKRELDQADIVLSIVYRQGLVWTGMAFCPAMPLLGLATTALIFYTYFKTTMMICKPPSKGWAQARTSALFMTALFITLIFVLVPIFIAMQLYEPNCGAYAEAKYSSMYDGFFRWKEEQSQRFKNVLDIIFSPACVLPLIFSLCVAVYVYRVRTHKWQRTALQRAEDAIALRRNHKKILQIYTQAITNTVGLRHRRASAAKS